MNIQSTDHSCVGQKWHSFKDADSDLVADWREGSPFVWVMKGNDYIGARSHHVPTAMPDMKERVFHAVSSIFDEILRQEVENQPDALQWRSDLYGAAGAATIRDGDSFRRVCAEDLVVSRGDEKNKEFAVLSQHVREGDGYIPPVNIIAFQNKWRHQGKLGWFMSDAEIDAMKTVSASEY